ncbi:MAG: MFS transporter, partial [Dehalococcoidia bacterium]|nr:MFS transporter [Dehalococcoidia bacterium]
MAQLKAGNAERPDPDETVAAATADEPREERPPGLFQIHKTFSAFSIPAYRVLWGSTIISLLGMQMQMVGRGILAYEIGGTNSAIAVVSLGWGLPMALFSLLGGTLADRFNRRKVMMTSQSCTMVIALSIAVLVHMDAMNLWLLFAFGLVQGTVFSFGGPARQSFIPEVVGEKQLMNAIALNQAGMNLTRIVGPSIAGALAAIAWIDLQGVFYTQACMNIIALVLLAAIPLSRRAEEPQESEIVNGVQAETNRNWGHNRQRRERGSISQELVNGVPQTSMLG